MASNPGIAAWHAYMAGGSLAALSDLIAEEAVFHSPVVHTPQAGKALVLAYLGAAGVVFGNDSFRYVREIAADDSVMLEFEVMMEGIHVNGVDIIRFDKAGRIVDFKVMVRPLKAINKVWELMAAQLQAAR